MANYLVSQSFLAPLIWFQGILKDELPYALELGDGLHQIKTNGQGDRFLITILGEESQDILLGLNTILGFPFLSHAGIKGLGLGLRSSLGRFKSLTYSSNYLSLFIITQRLGTGRMGPFSGRIGFSSGRLGFDPSSGGLGFSSGRIGSFSVRLGLGPYSGGLESSLGMGSNRLKLPERLSSHSCMAVARTSAFLGMGVEEFWGVFSREELVLGYGFGQSGLRGGGVRWVNTPESFIP